MKKILTLLFVINLTILYAQNESHSLLGKWKIISVNSGNIYLNPKTDSVSVSKKFKEVFSDSLELDNAIYIAKLMYNNKIMTFAENGIYTETIDSKILWTGTYQVNPSENEIIVTTKVTNWDMNYKIVDEVLYLNMGGQDKKTEFVLEKMKK